MTHTVRQRAVVSSSLATNHATATNADCYAHVHANTVPSAAVSFGQKIEVVVRLSYCGGTGRVAGTEVSSTALLLAAATDADAAASSADRSASML
jgi:hypothetical protein